MEYNTILEIVKKRRSIRKYKPEVVQFEDVLKILDAARWAPSGNNSQPWEFVVVKDPTKLQEVTDIFIDQSFQLREKTDNFKHAPSKQYLKQVSTFIFVCGDPRFISAFPHSTANEQIAAAIFTIMLAATSLGLGTAWLTGSGESETEARLRPVLNIPEVLDIICCIPLGYPTNNKPSRRKPRPLENVIHIDEFDKRKWRTDEDVRQFCNERIVWGEFYKTGESPNSLKNGF